MFIEISLPSGFIKTLTYEYLLDSQIKKGDWVEVPLRKKNVWGIVIDVDLTKPEFKTEKVIQIHSDFAFDSQNLAFYSWISKYYLAPINRVFDSVLPKDFQDLALGDFPSARTKLPLGIFKKGTEVLDFSLNECQKKADQAYQNALRNNQIRFLLFGLTGSGKTRLMAQWAREILKQNKSVLWMVPEIALTQQNLIELAKMLEVEVHLVHSGLTPGARKKLWLENQKGNVRVLLGTRSSILFPLKNLGFIVVDEEHDASYKQFDPTPRYNAKDAALYLSHLKSIPCVLASATPSLESYNLVLKNKLLKIELNERTNKGPLPEVRLIDQKQQSKYQGKKILSIPLREEIKRALEAKEQVILLHNRRGYATSLLCEDCGEAYKCDDCSVPLVWHQKDQRFHCHTCARLYLKPQVCKTCQSKNFDLVGDAIEKTEEELRLYFPEVKLARLDRDTASTPKKLEAILGDFRKGETEILLGTQMVAKGHDFPRVSLVGVIDGDIGSLLPDFRSDERQYQLLVQVFGRAGRSNIAGKVLVQTRQPDNEIIHLAKASNTAEFLQRELKLRADLNFPPFSRMLLIEFSGNNENEVSQICEACFNRAASIAQNNNILVKGPLIPMVAKAAKRYRYRLIFQAADANRLAWIYEQTLEQIKIPPTIKITADMDPQSVMI